jgi:prevent-host-death family protein
MCYTSNVLTIGVRELRQNASRYLHLVKAGERVAVTERGALVAYLVPATETRPSILDRLAAAGEYTPATTSILDLPPPPPTPEGARPLSEVLEEMRDEERW